MIGIYKITSPSKKIYIGQSTDIEKRWGYYKKLKCKKQTKLYRSFKKYGVCEHKFEIICQCKIYELNELERYYQDCYNVLSKNGLNCILTKTNEIAGEISTETRLKLSIINTGKTHSVETKAKISASNIGRIVSSETREKISKGNIGKIYSKKSREKMSASQKGRILSFETRKKMGESRNGRIVSEQTRKKISNSRKGIVFSKEQLLKMSSSASKKVLHLNTGVFFDSASSAADCFGFKLGNFRNMLSGNNKSNKTDCIYV